MADLMAGRATLQDHIKRAGKVEWRENTPSSQVPASPCSPSGSTSHGASSAFEDSRRGPSKQIKREHSPADTDIAPLAKIPKRKKRTADDDDQHAEPTAPNETTDTAEIKPPLWYTALPFNPKAKVKYNKFKHAIDSSLQTLENRLLQCKKAPNPEEFSKLADSALELIHKAMFLDVEDQMLRNHFLLTPKSGLPLLFDSPAPWYVQGDAMELYHKWLRRDFKSGLLRGLDTQATKLDPNYKQRRSGKTHGANGLIVGQWVPTQLCLLRDGAHNATQGGISGKLGQGAWSVVLSSGIIDSPTNQLYPNIDEGDVVYYCGTDSTKQDGPSDNTSLLLENERLSLPVRFIRSYAAPMKKYAPEAGFRYDGLYDVTGHEVLDPKIQRYRFKLVRRSGQLPIRCDGPGKRPNAEELEEFRRSQREKKFYVDDYTGNGQ